MRGYFWYISVILISKSMFGAHHIGGQLVTGQILHIFMVCVNDFCEFTAVDCLLKHPHVHRGVELVILGCVGAHNLGNGRAPVDEQRHMVDIVVSVQWLLELPVSSYSGCEIRPIHGFEWILIVGNRSFSGVI